ncbi:MAG: C40 family peptidase [Cellulosilyticaceae bacterium]
MKIRAVIQAIMIATVVACTAIPMFAAEYEGIVTKECNAKQVLQDGTVNEIPVSEGERVEILEERGNTYQVVLLENNYIVELAKDDVLVDAPKEEAKAEETSDEIIDYAKQFLGTKYVPGGNSLTKGVDCSGFTSQVFKKFGINLKRSSRDQYTSNGVKVAKSELEPGDLVFYGYNGSVSHVAIYIGDGEIIHASTGVRGVVVDPLELRGMPPFIGYKRVL